IGSGDGSVRNTRSHGTSTSSSHICPFSSSKRLLSGARNGFAWRAEIFRQTPVAIAVHSTVGADVDVLGVDGARVHPDLAAQHEAAAGLADDAKRRPLIRILAEPIADRGGTRRERQEAAGADDQVAI